MSAQEHTGFLARIKAWRQKQPPQTDEQKVREEHISGKPPETTTKYPLHQRSNVLPPVPDLPVFHQQSRVIPAARWCAERGKPPIYRQSTGEMVPVEAAFSPDFKPVHLPHLSQENRIIAFASFDTIPPRQAAQHAAEVPPWVYADVPELGAQKPFPEQKWINTNPTATSGPLPPNYAEVEVFGMREDPAASWEVVAPVDLGVTEEDMLPPRTGDLAPTLPREAVQAQRVLAALQEQFRVAPLESEE